MGEVTGGLKWVLRIEGLLLLVFALLIYAKYEFSWATFFIFFLVPDISFIGYVLGKKYGALCYNAAHSLIGAILCCATGIALNEPLLIVAGIIWVAHIGFDRALGYGLKYSAGFSYTHLGRIGNRKQP